MKTKVILTVSFLTLGLTCFAQEIDKSIDKQFAKLQAESTNYQYYSVIPKDKLAMLRKNVNDSIVVYRDSITKIQTEHQDVYNTIDQQKVVVDSLSKQVESIKKELEIERAKPNGFKSLGINITSTSFQVIVWGLIILWLLSIGIIIFRSKQSTLNTKDAIKQLADTELELEELRRNSLEREQKIRRQLQDEINKNRLSK
ncbi:MULTISPECIES: hypothetical protein [Myroides]|uniref:tRNA (Guanine-N1)-methyltransferase n=1 Tax=Myroides albus TaxID=2562892 RepID=A0A6I3LDB2_9FLAO|nr:MULTISPECIES: hypothetical protein [Myroides]MTG97479.1 hypothetical protein [Myroides albus]MVX34671.1 hypothetical protein [Myroides sp. LoEW2-1]UVD79510.1 hypothetical protein NWE55_15510 [Myroides albus]